MIEIRTPIIAKTRVRITLLLDVDNHPSTPTKWRVRDFSLEGASISRSAGK